MTEAKPTVTAERTAAPVAQPSVSKGAVAVRQPTEIEIEIDRREEQFRAVLPAHIRPDKFRNVILTAVNENPDLWKADRRSFFTSCVKCAQDGLLPDGREAALVIFNTKTKGAGGQEVWVAKVQYMPMVYGIRKRMRNTGEVLSADAHVVYQKDQFDYELGDNPHIFHKPAGLGDGGAPIGAYAIIKLTNGEILRDVMSVAAIERSRAISRAKDGPMWSKFWEEGAKKTVLRRCSKAAPTSAEIDRLLSRDEPEPGDEPVIPPEQLAPPRPRLADFSAPAGRELPHPGIEPEMVDEETGEIIEAEAEPAAESERPKRRPDPGPHTSPNRPAAGFMSRDEAAEPPTEPAQAHPGPQGPAAGPTGHAAPAATARAGKPVPPPRSPLKDRRAEWPPYVAYVLGSIREMPAGEINGWLSDPARAAEIDFIEQNRDRDWNEIQAIRDERMNPPGS
jgi:phage RecT family recombinase